jgi:tRNA (adenine57-N1/adenine58-N1)-methyltransferase
VFRFGPASNPLRDGELALLLDEKRKRYLIRLTPGADFIFHHGRLSHDDLIGGEEGVQALTNRGRPVWAYRPRLRDYLLSMPRSSAIIYPKDVAFMLMWADVFPGARVLEAGVGSGALSIALLRAIGPKGQLVSYEMRDDMAERATANTRSLLGDTPNWRLRIRDLYEGIDDGPFDRILLDLPDPGRAAPVVLDALVRGGMICFYVPNVTQVQAGVEAFEATHACSEIQAYETLFRPWEFRGPTARPARSMISHTGFLTFVRKGPPPHAEHTHAAPSEDRPNDA